MRVPVRGLVGAYFGLTAGAPLRFEPKFRVSESLDIATWNRLQKEQKGCTVEFVAWATRVVGVLNSEGLLPGIYPYPKRMSVRFPQGEIYELSSKHFRITGWDPRILWVSAPDPEADSRLRDLPCPLEFYPDDGVKIVSPPKGFEFLANILRPVEGVEWHEAEGGAWRYGLSVVKEDGRITVEATRRLASLSGTQLELVRRGNVRALYTDSPDLYFNSNQHEAAFWAHHGVSREICRETQTALPLSTCWDRFRDAEVDLVRVTKIPLPNGGHGHTEKYLLVGHKLHKQFVSYRHRVRALTKRLCPEAFASAA